MTKQEIKTARKEVQKLIKENKKELLDRIKSEYPKLIRLIKKNFDTDSNTLLDADFYTEIDGLLAK